VLCNIFHRSSLAIAIAIAIAIAMIPALRFCARARLPSASPSPRSIGYGYHKFIAPHANSSRRCIAHAPAFVKEEHNRSPFFLFVLAARFSSFPSSFPTDRDAFMFLSCSKIIKCTETRNIPPALLSTELKRSADLWLASSKMRVLLFESEMHVFVVMLFLFYFLIEVISGS
jgi:hypothetical protein